MNWFLLGLRYKLNDLLVRLRFEMRWWIRRQWYIEKVVRDEDGSWLILWRDSVSRMQRTTTKPASYYGRQ